MFQKLQNSTNVLAMQIINCAILFVIVNALSKNGIKKKFGDFKKKKMKKEQKQVE
jgi:hypothetical protein